MLWTVIVVVVVLVVYAAIVIAVYLSVAATTGSIKVTGIEITSTDDVCGLSGHALPGYTVDSGGKAQETLGIQNANNLSCTINTVSTPTSGFTISDANTPVTIRAGGTGALSFTINAPNGAYDGVLTLDFE